MPIKILFNGEPGIGKSALAGFLIRLLGGSPDEKWSFRKYNGTQIKLEVIDDIAATLQYRSLHAEYNIIWIDEADAIPAAAQVRFLTLLDDLPDAAAVIITSNCKVDDFKKRFQTRFKIYEMEPPAPHEIAMLLRRFVNDPVAVQEICAGCGGNVRAAMIDAETALDNAGLCLQSAA